MTDEESRGLAVREAIGKLNLVSAAQVDFAVHSIEQFSEYASVAKPTVAETPQQAADQLSALARTFKQLRVANESLGRLAIEELNKAKSRRGLTWWPPHTSWAFMNRHHLTSLLDMHYSEIESASEEAAAHLREKAVPGKTAGRGRNAFALEFAYLLARHYQMLTGLRPPLSKGQTPFLEFAEAIFAASGIKEKASSYVVEAAQRCRAAGENSL
jgi:hypothetical protein